MTTENEYKPKQRWGDCGVYYFIATVCTQRQHRKKSVCWSDIQSKDSKRTRSGQVRVSWKMLEECSLRVSR